MYRGTHDSSGTLQSLRLSPRYRFGQDEHSYSHETAWTRPGEDEVHSH